MFLKEVFQGIFAYGKAHKTICKYKLWPYMAIPAMLSFTYILGLAVLGWTYFGDAAAYVTQKMPEFMQGDIMLMLTTLTLWVLLTLTGYVTYQPIILVLCSPVLSYLSEVVELKIYKQPAPAFNFKNMAKDIIRSVIINARNLLKMILLMACAWMLVLIPLIGAVLSTGLMLFIQSFYNGYSLVDYTLERKRYSAKESVIFAKKYRFRISGVGFIFMGMLLVPVIGWLSAPAYGTVAATLSTLEKINGKNSG